MLKAKNMPEKASKALLEIRLWTLMSVIMYHKLSQRLTTKAPT